MTVQERSIGRTTIKRKHFAWLRAASIMGLAVVMLIACFQAYHHAISYERLASDTANLMVAEQRIDEVTERTLEILSLGLYTAATQHAERIDELTSLSVVHLQESRTWTIVYLGVVIAALMISATAPRRRRAIGVVAAWASLPALLIGVMAPILVIVAYKELPVLGETVLKFDSKGIISSVVTLWNSNNAIVGVIIVLFSVLFPLFKTFTLLAATIPQWRGWTGLPMHWLHVMGRWSMADIFVVALLLTFFVTDKAEVTRAEVQSGFYFFLSYVLLSQCAAWLLDNSDASTLKDD